MLKHMQTDHDKDVKNVEFTWNVLGKFRKPMRRQLTEAIHIEKAGKNALNLKNEYFKVNMNTIKLSNKEEEFVCNKCSRTFEDVKSLLDHKRVTHDRVKCQKCNFISFGSKDLERHSSEKHKV